MLEAALFRSLRIPVDVDHVLVHYVAVKVEEGDAASGEADHLQVIHVVNVTGVFQDGRNVRGQEGFPVAAPHDHRAVLAAGKDHVRIVLEHDDEGIGSAYADHCLRQRVNGADLIFAVVVIHLIDQDFGIRLRIEGVSLPFQLRAKFLIVLDDAVVDADDHVFGRNVRVCIGLARFAVGRPARMADAAASGDVLAAVRLFNKAFQPSLNFNDFRVISAVPYGDAGRVIASVFQFCQSFQEYRGCLAGSDVTYDSTH